MREMKDSGIEWIRDIPIKWDIIKFKYYFSIIGGNGFKEKFQGEETGDYPFCKASDINGISKKINKAKNYVSEEIAKQENYSIIPKNSILISKIGESLKKNHRKINSVPCIVDNNCEAFTLKRKDDIDYLYYLMTVINMMWFDNGGTIPSVNNEKLRNFYLPNPSVNEQQRISTYLDDKCAKIDTIIEKQQKIIEKLKDYKLSRINEIVTNVDGIECNLGRISSMKNGLNFNMTLEGNKVKFLGVGDFKDYFVLNEKEMFSEIIITEEIPQEYLLENGDIVFVRSNGSKELVGRAVMVENIDFALTYSGFCIRFRNTRADLIDDKYLLYFFRSTYFRKQLERYSQGSNISNINQVLLSQISIIIPSPNYQITALETLDKLSSSIDSIITKKQILIEKLTEYKKSLIYEVVTGKKEV